jgi:putative endonuclease
VFYVYLMASKPHGTLYVGVTSDLAKRVFEHKSKAVPGFTARYRVDTLVWFEAHDAVEGRSAGRSRSRSGNASGNST